jgi:hypothetical protein
LAQAALGRSDIGQERRRVSVFSRTCRIAARSIPMLDVVMLAIAFAFFALSIAYVYACDQL